MADDDLDRTKIFVVGAINADNAVAASAPCGGVVGVPMVGEVEFHLFATKEVCCSEVGGLVQGVECVLAPVVVQKRSGALAKKLCGEVGVVMCVILDVGICLEFVAVRVMEEVAGRDRVMADEDAWLGAVAQSRILGALASMAPCHTSKREKRKCGVHKRGVRPDGVGRSASSR